MLQKVGMSGTLIIIHRKVVEVSLAVIRVIKRIKAIPIQRLKLFSSRRLPNLINSFVIEAQEFKLMKPIKDHTLQILYRKHL